jgi:hypothetical protein
MMKWLGKDSVQTKVNSKPTSIIANHNTFLKPFNPPLQACKDFYLLSERGNFVVYFKIYTP